MAKDHQNRLLCDIGVDDTVFFISCEITMLSTPSTAPIDWTPR